MKTFYFTFGIGHKFARCVQPVIARTKEEAEKAMQQVHGTNYAFGYDYDPQPNYKKLSLFIVKDEMSNTEFHRWKERLNNILEVSGPLKKQRLKNMLDDLVLACDLSKDVLAKCLYKKTYKEFMEVA